MPPWVARQCHVWRCSRPVSGSVSLRAPVNPRFFAQTATRYARRPPKIQAPKSAVIIPSSVADTRPEDILSHIEPLSKSHAMRYRFAVFFVTPSFARWLLDDSVFLHKALTNIYPELLGPNTRPRIHALCAVVDRLPVPRPIEDKHYMMREAYERLRNPPVGEIGHEGIAYAALPFHDSIATSSAKDQVKAAISFVSAKGEGGEEADLSDAIRLPLANTVFQTGSPTTMTYSYWAVPKGSKKLTLKEKRDVSHHGIRMQTSPENSSSMLSIPLIPLSKPRLVEASMGNILRRITGPGGESITASQELEKNVPRYFSARREPSQATTVWALIMDREVLAAAQGWTDTLLEAAQFSEGAQTEDTLWEDLWKTDPPVWNPLVTHALASGARLHRVLSGGGGWGKKAGLLSLDPMPVPSSDSSEFGQLDGPGDLSDALQQVAREGDSIQFFISPSATPDVKLPKISQHEEVWGLELGTIPSTTDALPAAAKQSKTNKITVYKNMFGALSEGGMVMSRSFKVDGESSYGLIGASTIDVPFTRFSAVDWVAEPKPGDDAEKFRKCLEPEALHFAARDVLAENCLAKDLPVPSFMNMTTRMSTSKWKDSLSPQPPSATALKSIKQAMHRRAQMPTPTPSSPRLQRSTERVERAVQRLAAALALLNSERRARANARTAPPRRPRVQAETKAETDPAPPRLPIREVVVEQQVQPEPLDPNNAIAQQTPTSTSRRTRAARSDRAAFLAQRVARFKREGLRKHVSGPRTGVVRAVSGEEVWSVDQGEGGIEKEGKVDEERKIEEEEGRGRRIMSRKRRIRGRVRTRRMLGRLRTRRVVKKESEKEAGKRELSETVMGWLR